MDVKEFAVQVLDQLPFEPTDQQIQLVAALSRFCSAATPADSVFLLNGYAGTGKTSVMGALVRTLEATGIHTVLLASTGRAAKVFSAFTGMPAHTIHRKIYRSPGIGPDGRFEARLCPNPHINTVFIVDEASMIGDDPTGASSLLQDLVMYVYTGINCRLILLGDTAQLPPVGLSESPAMDPAKLKEMGLRVTRAVMTRTVRQKQRSGILFNATALRRALRQNPLPEPSLTATPFSDIDIVDPEDLEDRLRRSFDRYGEGETIMITRSNRRAVDFNRAIRAAIFDREEVMVRGERLLVAKNNYFWCRPSVVTQGGVEQTQAERSMDFIANGDTAIVEEIYSTEERQGVTFADARLYFPDHNARADTKLLLDALTAETAGAAPDTLARLTSIAFADAGITAQASVTAQRKALKESPYANALQVKYAYAVTCHKAQGGQWRSVFVDMGYIPPEAYRTEDFYRWLYTAVTRASDRLHLVNPSLPVN